MNNNNKIGLNQGVARKMNNILAVEEFRKKPISGTELSEILHLSNATSSSIIKSLLSNKILREDSISSISGLGRKRLRYSLNEEYGLLLVISITSYQLHLVISDINCKTLYELKSEIDKYDFSLVKKVIDDAKLKLVSNQFKKISLKCVVISLPGLINTKTSELQNGPQFADDFTSKNISDYVTKTLNCDVMLFNDTKLMMAAELASGEFSEATSGMLAYIDYGVGGSFEFDDKLYLGSRGYGGEIGRININIEDKQINLDDAASIRSMKEAILEKTGDKYKTNEIIEAFKQGDKFVEGLVLRSAYALALVIKDIIRVFDIEQFTISGRVSEFGDRYLEEIKKVTSKDNPDAIIRFSKLEGDAIIEGAKSVACSHIIDEALKNI